MMSTQQVPLSDVEYQAACAAAGAELQRAFVTVWRVANLAARIAARTGDTEAADVLRAFRDSMERMHRRRIHNVLIKGIAGVTWLPCRECGGTGERSTGNMCMRCFGTRLEPRPLPASVFKG